MNLPHGELLLFAKKVMHRSEESIEVYCVFPGIPSLAMFLEAAAQCSAGFNTEETMKMGFLTMGKNIKLLESIHEKSFIFTLTKEAQINEFSQYSFEARAAVTKRNVVTGSFTLQIKA